MKTIYYIIHTFILYIFSSSLAFSQNAEETYQNGLEKIASEEFDQAIVLFDQAMKLEKKDNDAMLAGRGLAYLKLGKYRKAIADYKKAIKLNGKEADYFYHRAVAQDSIDKDQEALQDYSIAIKLNSDDEKYYVGRAHLYYKNKNYKSAISNLNYALQIRDNAQGYFMRGMCKYFMVDTVGACKDWQKAKSMGKVKEVESLIEKNCEGIEN